MTQSSVNMLPRSWLQSAPILPLSIFYYSLHDNSNNTMLNVYYDINTVSLSMAQYDSLAYTQYICIYVSVYIMPNSKYDWWHCRLQFICSSSFNVYPFIYNRITGKYA